ncbi:MAG: hypothetical protein LBC39_07395 [Methanobrevibacter sp.]|jgi:hypothetical protein|nr:hypothetical protein [Candidatus Methanovirga aequatorialis]
MADAKNLNSATDLDTVETINTIMNWLIDQNWNIFGHSVVLRDHISQFHIDVTTDGEDIYYGVMTGSIDLGSIFLYWGLFSMLLDDYDIDRLGKLAILFSITLGFVNYVIGLLEKMLNVQYYRYHLNGFFLIFCGGLVFFIVYKIFNRLFKEDNLNVIMVTFTVMFFLTIVFNNYLIKLMICDTCGG